MPTLRQAVKRLRDRWLLPTSGPVSAKDLNQRFQPVPYGSLRSLLLKMNMLADVAEPVGGSTHPYYRRYKPKPQDASLIDSDTAYIDLTNVHLPPYGDLNTVAEAVRLFDARSAAAVSAATGLQVHGVVVFPSELLEKKDYGDTAPEVVIPKAKCLASLAYPDFFPVVPKDLFFPDIHADDLRRVVSDAILAANPGWCGTFGPGVEPTDLLGDYYNGDYDMSQMHLLPIAYRYFDELFPAAREHLITQLLAAGRIHRVGLDDTLTHGGMPNDWSQSGLGLHIRIAETENHILTILTARYLTNQLLYQRDHDPVHDNRRNGAAQHGPHCTALLLTLLRDILRDDFSEYNAKNYQTQTRDALLNLCSYAYDHEVRLAARMVLDYVSARLAVSSNDLRRMVPFRRRNEGKNVKRDYYGSMEVGLLETTFGADPMAQHFAILAGNTRIYATRAWHIKTDGTDGNDAVMYALSDYRLPPSIHDLFVNDSHRRFFQRLHRVVQEDVEITGRNCDNHEINASSPSYLFTAGGRPDTYAIDPGPQETFAPSDAAKQLGVAVTTSFMPTTRLDGGCGDPTQAIDLIQFSSFSDEPGAAVNYGVAPDFACGHILHLPAWCLNLIRGPNAPNANDHHGKFQFVDRGSNGDGPGFYLAIYSAEGDIRNDLVGNCFAMEAFDTWLHPNVLTFEQFKQGVLELNGGLNLAINVEAQYTTQNGNRLRVLVWDHGENEFATSYGARIQSIEYGTGNPVVRDPEDSLGDAGTATDQFLRGTVMNSREEGVVEITNPFLGTKITLDMRDPKCPRRTSETGEVEEAGNNHEVWVNFGWKGPSEGDFFRPFNTITAAAAAVANGGVIKIVPGWTTEKPFFQSNKRIRLVAPIGNVTFGVR